MAAKGPTITYTRGDTAPHRLHLTQDGADLDLTGFTNIEIVVNPNEEPADALAEILRQPGTLTGTPTDGRIDFQPVGASVAARKTESDAYPPGEYFYDLQVDDGAGERVTLLNGGAFNVAQDINKQ
jgi:nitrogen regulatory protein PII